MVWLGSLEENDHIVDLDVDGKILLKWSPRRGLDWVDVTWDRDR